MIRFALRGVRRRWTSYLAAGAVLFAGTALLTAFALLLETGLAPGAAGNDTLVMLPAILGGWTVLIVVFGVVSTIALTVQQRERELALLRSIAATVGQVRRVVVAEVLAVAVPAIALGILPGVGLGAFVLSRLRAAGTAPDGLGPQVGSITLLGGAALAVVSALVAAIVASRRAGAVPPIRALAAASVSRGPALSRVRRTAGLVSTALGAALSITTFFMPNDAMLSSTAGPAGVAVAIGLALLSPALIPGLGRVAGRLIGAPVRQAGRNLTVEPGRAAVVVAPLVLLIGIAGGTLYLQATEDSVQTGPRTPGDVASLSSVNYLIVAMIVAFCAILVLNTLIAATRRRRREFGLLRLTAATRSQVIGIVLAETLLTGGLATVLGTIAAVSTTAPYSMVRTGSLIPAGSIWIYVGVVAGGFALAFLATLPTTVRSLWTPPVEAIAAV
ncbi:FtsX-like permease family protein [Kribbella sp. DT2]|uniref:ABC transporter permease n=1 Tax=Kribbella sp. DT2 TaxID=3393427 RepID=UPI003CEC6C86